MAREYNEILKTWIVVWDALVKYTKLPENEQKGSLTATSLKHPYNQEVANLLADLVDINQLCEIINKIYQWVGNEGIYFCGNKDLMELNMIKYNASELHWRLLQYVT